MHRIRTVTSVLFAMVAILWTGVCRIDGAERTDTPATTVTVAAVSYVPTKFDLDGNADRLEAAFRKAKAGGAQIAVAPEGGARRLCR